MGHCPSSHVSWSVRLDPGSVAQRASDQIIDRCRELLGHHFPDASGYETRTVGLSGPLQGVRWTITRGSFVAWVGVQRYPRAYGGSTPTEELRLVASMGLVAPPLEAESIERRVVGWAMVGWGLGSVALGAMLLGLGGLLTGWAQALLLVPAVAAWRASVAALVQRADLRTRALGGRSQQALCSPRVEESVRRFAELLPELRAERERLQDACGRPPFRSLGHVPLASPSLTWAPLARAANEPTDRAAAPPEGTMRTRSR